MHCSANAEAMGSNPVEALPKNLFQAKFAIALIVITFATVISSFRRQYCYCFALFAWISLNSNYQTISAKKTFPWKREE